MMMFQWVISDRQRWGCLGEAYHGIGVRDKVFESIQEALILHQLCVYVVKFCNTHSSCLSHIRVFILQTFPEGLTQVLCYLVHTNAAHGTNSKGPDERIRVFTVLDEWFRESVKTTHFSNFFHGKMTWHTRNASSIHNAVVNVTSSPLFIQTLSKQHL